MISDTSISAGAAIVIVFASLIGYSMGHHFGFLKGRKYGTRACRERVALGFSDHPMNADLQPGLHDAFERIEFLEQVLLDVNERDHR